MIPDIISNLINEFGLDTYAKIKLDTELALTRLKVEYAIFKHKEENIPFYNAMEKYAAINKYLRQDGAREIIGEFIQKIKELNNEVIENLILDLFYHSNKTLTIIEDSAPKNCFMYDIDEKNNAAIHFWNNISPKNPFKGIELKYRKNELTEIAKDLKQNHPGIKSVVSMSWMWNLRVFKNLMPEEFNQSLNKTNDDKFYSDAHWGQFYRYDGSLNKERIEQFKKNWNWPLKPLSGECDKKVFIAFYS